jgi:uncharacterized RDD family membrane protein YckC
MSGHASERGGPGGFEDLVRIETPEGVELELTLANIGSRFMAGSIDLAIQIAVLLAAGLLLRPAGNLGGALFAIASFGLVFGYDVLFEVLGGGRTIGKRATGLRVVRTGGRPIGLVRSAVRNVLRVVDVLPAFYFVGAVAVFVSRHNQRLGDMAAGSYVIRERFGPRGGEPAPAKPADAGAAAGWDVSAVGAEDIATVRAFLTRRYTLDDEPRRRLARELADRLRPRVAGVPPGLGNERFLELLAAAKGARE